MPPTRHPSLPYWWMLAGACFFSLMALLAQRLGGVLSWQVIALVRTSLALAIAAGMTYFGGARFVFFSPATLWIRSIAGSCSLLLTFYALTHTRSLSEVLVLSNMFPVWVALLSWPVLGVLPRWDTWLAIASAMAGVILVQRPSLEGVDWALAAAAAGSFTTSIAMLGLHRLQHLDPRSIVAHFSAVSVLFCVAALVMFPHNHSQEALADPQTLAMLLAVGVTATIGQLFLTKAFSAGSPARVSVVSLSQIGITAVFDAWNKHYLAPTTIAGMALILLPTIWILLRSDAARDADVIAEAKHSPPPLE